MNRQPEMLDGRRLLPPVLWYVRVFGGPSSVSSVRLGYVSIMH